MNPQQVAAWAQALAILIPVFNWTRDAIRALIGRSQPEMTEVELNTAFDAVIAHDLVRKALAEADAAGGSVDPARRR